MIIDVHGHYTTYPPGVDAYRGAQIAQMGAPSKGTMNVTDDEIRHSIEMGQLKAQRDRAVALKLAGEYGRQAPPELRGVIAVSPSIDLASCADAIELRSNIIYHFKFITSLRNRLRRKARLFPDRFDVSRLRGVWTPVIAHMLYRWSRSIGMMNWVKYWSS